MQRFGAAYSDAGEAQEPIQLKEVHFRDLPLEPWRGFNKSVQWLQFHGSCQLWKELKGEEWDRVDVSCFNVQVSHEELKVQCTIKALDKSGDLDDLNCKLKRRIETQGCWYTLGPNLRGDAQVLVISLQKQNPGEVLKQGILAQTLFKRQSFAWREEQKTPAEAFTKLEPGVRYCDPFLTNRSWLCLDMLEGHGREWLQFRLVLDRDQMDWILRQVPSHRLWAMDVRERHLSVMIRGDERSPMLSGELSGRIIPDQSWISLSDDKVEVEEGKWETMPCLDIWLIKADPQEDWQDPLKVEDHFLQAIGWNEEQQQQQQQESLTQITPLHPRLYRIRDFTMEPSTGMHRSVRWMHFAGTVHLWFQLHGPEWADATESDFDVKVSGTALSVKSSRDKSSSLHDLCCQLRGEVKPSECRFCIEIDQEIRTTGEQGKILCIELAKRSPTPWNGIFVDRIRTTETTQDWITMKGERRKDEEDPFLASRGWLCSEMDQGQTDENVTFRIVLDNRKLDECLEKVPYYKIFALDIFKSKYMSLFIRGDEPHPILVGELEGNCMPLMCTMELTTVTREVEGHKVPGTTEQVRALDVTIVKAPDSQYEWEEPLRSPDDMDAPQGTLQDVEQKMLVWQHSPNVEESRDDWTPDDWADEQKCKGDKAFKEKNYRDAIVYYTRALRYTPENDKILCNRSAAYMRIDKYSVALDDAQQAQKINPTWPKVFYRKGQALRGLRDFDGAISAFEEGKALGGDITDFEKEIEVLRRAKEALEMTKISRK